MQSDMLLTRGDCAERTPFDPFAAVPIWRDRYRDGTSGVRLKQRMRRAEVRSATRRLLAERGCDGVTVRAIAREAGFALQTIYNLAGPRDQAIMDAITEWSLYVSSTAGRRHEIPSLVNVVDMWIEAAQDCPLFARQCNLMMFGASREIYYRFRDVQIRAVAKLLRMQRDHGLVFHPGSVRATAEQLVFHSTALWTDWADRPYPLEDLRNRLASGLTKLMRN